MSFREIIDNRIVPFISLSMFDDVWRTTLEQSSLFGIWLKLKTACQTHLTSLANLAPIIDFVSFILVALLFLILPAPQFADDKNILALVVTSTFALRVVAQLLSSKIAYRPCAVDALVLAFAAMNVVATASSHYLEPSIKGLSKMAVYFCSYFLFVAVLQKATRQRSLVILAALLGAGLAVSLYGIYQFKIHVAPLATWEDPSIEDKTTRVYSTLRNPNLLAGYLIPLIPLSAGLTVMSLCQKGIAKLLVLPALGTTIAIIACSIFTGSRGGFLGIAASLAVFGLICMASLWARRPKLRPLLILVLFVIPVILVIGVHANHSLEHRILSITAGSEHSSNAYRMYVYRSSLQMFKDSWWIGIGPGNSTFKLIYGLYMRSGFDALGTYCVPLEVAVETGIVGLAIFAGMVVSVLGRAHQNFWNNMTPERWIAAASAAALIAMMVHGCVDTVFYRPQVQFIFWLLLAMCICCAAVKPSEHPSESSSVEMTPEAAPQDRNAAA